MLKNIDCGQLRVYEMHNCSQFVLRNFGPDHICNVVAEHMSHEFSLHQQYGKNASQSHSTALRTAETIQFPLMRMETSFSGLIVGMGMTVIVTVPVV